MEASKKVGPKMGKHETSTIVVATRRETIIDLHHPSPFTSARFSFPANQRVEGNAARLPNLSGPGDERVEWNEASAVVR